MSGRDARPPGREEVMRWTDAERRELARILDEQIRRPEITGPLRRRRLLVLAITGGGALLLGPWIAYLTSNLPPSIRSGQWRTAWVGFDVAVAITLGITAWLVWHRRALSLVALAVSATLIVVDAWFDVTLSWGTSEQSAAVLAALLVSTPVTIILITAIRTMLRRTFAVVQQLRGDDSDPVSVWRQPVVMQPPRSD